MTTALRSLGLSPEDAVSVTEIARLLGVARITAHRYTQRDDFPEPLAATSAGRVWLRKDVERWAKDHLPLPEGRPRKDVS
jgi:predicted DNA-binding transcriptional regulator AlpA